MPEPEIDVLATHHDRVAEQLLLALRGETRDVLPMKAVQELARLDPADREEIFARLRRQSATYIPTAVMLDDVLNTLAHLA